MPLPLPPLSYLVPFEQAPPTAGSRVVVPWQGGVRIGLVYASGEAPASRSFELRELLAVLDERPFIPPAYLPILAEVAEAYAHPLGGVLAALLATGLHEPLAHQVRAVAGADIALPADGWVDAATLVGAELELWRSQGLIRERFTPLVATERQLVPLRPVDGALAGKPQAAQRAALAHLWQQGRCESAAALARAAQVGESSVRALISKGYAGYRELPAPPPELPSYPPRTLPSGVAPAPEGASVMGGRRSERLAALLPLMQATLAAGRSVLVLVPEHYLLAETASYLSSALPVVTLHGELTEAQRRHLWHSLTEPIVLVGSYLALLAPLAALGRLVVLEAASGSYKLLSGPRLHIPDVAQRLAARLNLPIHFSDALLSPEQLVTQAVHQLPYRPQRIHLSDLSRSRNWPLSSELIRLLKQVETRSRQALVLAPRRGFSAALGCAQCGQVAMCPNCDLALRYHQRTRELRCHQCNHRCRPPDRCPNCGGYQLGPMRGAGGEWLARELQRYLKLPIYHYDAECRDDLSPLLAGAPGVVVATSAIWRHPPLPNLSLIALALADSLFGVSDFRADELALRLLLQLDELSGRPRPLVLLQTFQPHHPLLSAMAERDPNTAVPELMQALLARRQRYRYPPYGQLVKLQISAKSAAAAEREAHQLADMLRLQLAQVGTDAELLGPSPAVISRLKGRYHYQLFIKTPPGAALGALLAPLSGYRGRAAVRLDPAPRDVGELLE